MANLSRISWIIFILLIIQIAETLAGFKDVPPPPVRPDRFHSREELKRYLQLVHEYYAIIGRPRFGRSFRKNNIQSNDQHRSHIIDLEGDHSTSLNEYHHRFGE